MPRLENWSVVVSGSRPVDPYMAPELQEMLYSRCLHGTIYDHPLHDDGKQVRTSRIVEVEGKTVKTYSGSIYELGTIAQEYVDWMKENGIEYDPENPIKFKS